MALGFRAPRVLPRGDTDVARMRKYIAAPAQLSSSQG